jgi:hypothetical protein
LSIGLHLSVTPNQPFSELRQSGAAAGSPPKRRGGDGLAKCLIELSQQQPSPAIGHIHRAACRGNWACFLDFLEETDLAGADRGGWREVNADRETGHIESLTLPPSAVIIEGGWPISRARPSSVHEVHMAKGYLDRLPSLHFWSRRVIEFDSVEKAIAAHDSPAYQQALTTIEVPVIRALASGWRSATRGAWAHLLQRLAYG